MFRVLLLLCLASPALAQQLLQLDPRNELAACENQVALMAKDARVSGGWSFQNFAAAKELQTKLSALEADAKTKAAELEALRGERDALVAKVKAAEAKKDGKYE